MNTTRDILRKHLIRGIFISMLALLLFKAGEPMLRLLHWAAGNGPPLTEFYC